MEASDEEVWSAAVCECSGVKVCECVGVVYVGVYYAEYVCGAKVVSSCEGEGARYVYYVVGE